MGSKSVWAAVVVTLGVASCDSGGMSHPSGGSGAGGSGQGGSGASTSSVGGATTNSGTSTGATSTSSSTTASTSSSTTATTSATTSSATTSTGSGGTQSCHYPSGYPNGSVTYYTLSMGSNAVNCSFDILGKNPDVVAHVPFGGGKYFGAMNTTDYANAAVCGACVQVDRDNGKSVQVTIVDQCPSAGNPVCKAGHIDLSQEAFLQIGTVQEGYLGTTNGGAAGKISWHYIPCPTKENVSFRLKDPSNQYWNQILVMGHGSPIASLEVLVNGAWQPGTRQSYNYWQVGNGNMGPAPYHVRVTDVNGDTVDAMLSLQGGDQTTTQQFPVCQ